MPRHFVVIPAAGLGLRMGAVQEGVPLAKQFMQLRGKTLLEHAISVFLDHPGMDQIVVAVSPGDLVVEAALRGLMRRSDSAQRLHIVPCGAQTRHSTVCNALHWLASHARTNSTEPLSDDWVLVHDAARPGLRQSVLQRLLDAVHAGAEHGVAGGILALPIADTLKRAKLGTNWIEESPSRQDVWAAQTPQMFRLKALTLALDNCLVHGSPVTDEASAMELAGAKVALVLGDRRNLKVTYPEDLEWLEAIWTQ